MKIIEKSDFAQIDNFNEYEEETSNFALSFLFLPKEKSSAISNIYNFCSYADDIIDCSENTDKDEIKYKKNLLTNWLAIIKKIISKESYPAILEPFAQTIHSFNIPYNEFEILITGVGSDLDKREYENMNELLQYCYGVASSVGLICLNIFGDTSENARNYAINLGYALQLTNIIRDVKADLERNYIYIPKNLLQKYGVLLHKDLKNNETEKFQLLLVELGEEAENYYSKAKQDLSKCKNKRLFLASEIMGSIYHKILLKMKKQNYNVFEGKIRVNKFTKIITALKTVI